MSPFLFHVECFTCSTAESDWGPPPLITPCMLDTSDMLSASYHQDSTRVSGEVTNLQMGKSNTLTSSGKHAANYSVGGFCVNCAMSVYQPLIYMGLFSNPVKRCFSCTVFSVMNAPSVPLDEEEEMETIGFWHCPSILHAYLFIYCYNA